MSDSPREMDWMRLQGAVNALQERVERMDRDALERYRIQIRADRRLAIIYGALTGLLTLAVVAAAGWAWNQFPDPWDRAAIVGVVVLVWFGSMSEMRRFNKP